MVERPERGAQVVGGSFVGMRCARGRRVTGVVVAEGAGRSSPMTGETHPDRGPTAIPFERFQAGATAGRDHVALRTASRTAEAGIH